VVGAQDVHAPAVDEGWDIGEAVQQQPQPGTDALGWQRPWAGAAWFGDAEQVGALQVVEPQGTGDRVEDRGRDVEVASAFQADVVVDADARELSDLLAPQAGHPPDAGLGWQPGLVRGDFRPPGAQEIAQFRVRFLSHVSTVNGSARGWWLRQGVCWTPGPGGSPAAAGSGAWLRKEP
jgi:hypothetical protein